MVQFNVLSGKQAGTQWVARRFPVRVGRSQEADLVLEDAGVWQEHFELRFERGHGYVIRATPDALTRVNGETLAEGLLRNGDVLDLGAVRLQFWLAATKPAGLATREWATWLLVGAMSLGQVALIYFLLSL